MKIIRWFLSRKVRLATAMYRHVGKLLAAQRDILAPQAIQAVEGAIASLRQAVEQGADAKTLTAQMDKLEKTANKWIKPYPNAAWRENLEVFLVAIAVAMAIRTFFLQPFKIPTGSLQPTLYGITSNPDLEREREFPENNSPTPDFQVPNGIQRFFQYWISGISYVHVVANSDGPVTAIEEPKHLLLFNLSQRFEVGDEWYTVWFPPDEFMRRAGLGVFQNHQWYCNPRVFKAGEDIVKMRVVEGDHLFVNRVTYNFRHPERGEIIVFKTAGINYDDGRNRVPKDEFYIKRLVALGGEHVQIGDDHHLIIDGKRLDSSTPHFENLYNFRADAGDNEYFGHVQEPGSLFDSSEAEYTVPTNDVLVMGDNTRNSLDGRYFGGFDQKYIIGKASFVYWPISSRFGFGYE